jgi:hypothetical protein
MLRSTKRSGAGSRHALHLGGAAAGILVAGGLATIAGGPAQAQSDAASAKRAAVRDVSANLFEWNWPSVARECTTVLGPAGYGGVQVAPPQDSLKRTALGNGSATILHPWWEVYQPVDYNLTSRMGNEAQFRSMVTTCRKAGVKVIVDAVINHMSGQGNLSYGGVTYSKYSYTGLYNRSDFHSYPADCPIPPAAGSADREGSIQDFNDYTQVFHCELVGLADLRTETTKVRNTLAAYLNKLIGYGVSGFRVDAAKHIGQTDLAAIESRLHRTVDGTQPFLALEVTTGSPGRISPWAFQDVGDLLGFDYATQIHDAFKSYNDPPNDGNIGDLKIFGTASGVLPSNKELVWIENPRHRAQRVHAQLQGPEQHDRQRVHARLAARHPPGVRELRLDHAGRLAARGRQRAGDRHELHQRHVDLRRPIHRREGHGRLPQLCGRRPGEELVRRRRQPRGLQPRRPRVLQHEQRNGRQVGHRADRIAGRYLLRHHPRFRRRERDLHRAQRGRGRQRIRHHYGGQLRLRGLHRGGQNRLIGPQ